MQTLETLLERKFQDIANLRIADLRDGLISRTMSLEDYRYTAGKIEGIKECFEILEEAREAADQRNR